MGREDIPYRLTDQQLEALDILSMDCGLTNRKLTSLLGKNEREEGNIRNKVTKPLLSWGMIYQVKAEYPNKLLYINKSYENIHEILRAISDPICGRLLCYDRIHFIEQREYDQRKWNYIKNCDDEAPPISDKHLEARSRIESFIHLYLWCKKILEIYQAQLFEPNTRPEFSLISPTPPCTLCQKVQRRLELDTYFQDHMRILWERDRHLAKIKAETQHGIHNVRELQLTST